jgi:hypothetical protein
MSATNGPASNKPVYPSFPCDYKDADICFSFNKPCATPGCKFGDFHSGPHSNEALGMKRLRQSVAEKVDGREGSLVVDARGLSGYGGLCKTGHREAFVYTCLTTRGPVAYLDGPDGALTSLLLSRGVASDRLTPFNLSSKAATAIEDKCPGVKCRVEDICEAAANADEEHFSSVWFDMCGVDFGKFDVADLVHCAEYKFYTLSCRQLLCSDQQSVLCARLAEAGDKIMERSLYTGCSGKAMNMVFVVSKRDSHKKAKISCGSSDDEYDTECDKLVNIGTIVRFPLSYWKNTEFLKAYNFKVFDDNFLMGAVHSQVSNSSSSYRLSFQVEGGGSMLCSSKYSRACVLDHAI